MELLMSFSIQRETSDGTLSTLDLTIEYIDRTDVRAYVNDIEIDLTGGSTPYTWEWITDSQIKITPNVPNGLVAMLKRSTPMDAMYHIYDAGAIFKDETIDENFKQVLFLSQEAKEGSGVSDIYSNVNMHGYVIGNHGAAVLDGDLVTFGQYRNDSLGSGFNRVAAEAARDVAVAAKDTAVAYATAAGNSAGAASTSATNAANSASASDAARVLAQDAATTAVAAYDSFDDRYLGPKNSNPTLDNDGNTLLEGALYWSIVAKEMRVYTGTAWAVAYLPADGYLEKSQNLADLIDAAAARSNIGLGNVSNTSDADKPISTAQAAGLVAKTSATGAAVIPVGTEAQRPGSPTNGQFRYNSDTNQFEGYQNGVWGQVGGGSPLFSVMWWPQRSAIPAGFVAADGQTLNRLTYPDAWAGILAGNVPTVADATWNSTPTERGKFTVGNGTSTFRLPDYNGKFSGSLGALFLRGDGTLSATIAGAIQQDAMQNITGTISPSSGSGLGSSVENSTGAFGRGAAKGLFPTFGNSNGFDINFDASRVARTATETRPLNVTGCWVIKLFGAVVNVGSADAAQLASDYANLVAALNQLDFTIIYPNGGSVGSPASVTINSRYVEANPFPGYHVIVDVQVFDVTQGVWGNPSWNGFNGNSPTGSRGIFCTQVADNIVLLTGGVYVLGLAQDGNPFTPINVRTSAPCRVRVWKVKGAAA
ncbi:phage tail protein [Sphingobium sp. CFD-1]|uniref:phage tail protein n=1 Tax=Sphingobium sp. CFD-1 TaxID=2878545 RepID=UPI00214B0AAD|nr:phage tail protein [Sphingobium sp. CFD-1]